MRFCRLNDSQFLVMGGRLQFLLWSIREHAADPTLARDWQVPVVELSFGVGRGTKSRRER